MSNKFIPILSIGEEESAPNDEHHESDPRKKQTTTNEDNSCDEKTTAATTEAIPKVIVKNSSFCSSDETTVMKNNSSFYTPKMSNLTNLDRFMEHTTPVVQAQYFPKAIATVAALEKKYGAEITVVVIDEKQKETLPEHETQLSSIRWDLSEGGFQEFKLLERLGEGSKTTAIIGEISDELNLDLVVMSMEAIHSKHVDFQLLSQYMTK